MITPISSLNSRTEYNQRKNTAKTSLVSFKAIEFLEISNKFKPIESELLTETRRFLDFNKGASFLGRGLFSTAYLFNKFKNIVIKKPLFSDDFVQESNALKAIPDSLPSSQQFVARAFDDDRYKYYLLSTKVNGNSPDPNNNPWTSLNLRSLFTGMYEMDKAGLYHGDLNNGNLKLERNGQVNFLDFQWGTKTDQYRFFENNSIQCLPNFIPIQNSQMLEMAEVPYYIKKLDNQGKAKKFLSDYLGEKSRYHRDRVKNIYNITGNWAYTSEIPYINKAKKYESAQEEMFRNISPDTLKLETLKIHFLSAFREASKYLDPNTPEKNIITAPSAYLYALSTVQSFRNEINKQQRGFTTYTKDNYLEGLKEYADFWYNNLKEWTVNAFYYPYRHTQNELQSWETLHNFDSPNINIEHFDDMTNVSRLVDYNFEPDYSRNFEIKDGKTSNAMKELAKDCGTISAGIFSKDGHKTKELLSAYKRLKSAYQEERGLDVINTALLLTRRAYEMYDLTSEYKYRTIMGYASSLSERVFKKIYNQITVSGSERGYSNMNHFQ